MIHNGLAYYVSQGLHLPPEVEEGNIEYKFKINPESDQRIQNLTTQLQWRLTEYGECYYFIGVDDDGTIVGIFNSDMDISLERLKEMCQSVGAEIVSIDRQQVSRLPKLFAAQVLIRRSTIVEGSTVGAIESDMRSTKVAFIGESGGGKSTLIGVLLGAGKDDGSGAVRSGLLKHRHELISGQTSSVTVEMLPFDSESQRPIQLDEFIEPLPLNIQRKMLGARRVCQMVDMAGDQRYLKTTLSALTSWATPDLIALIIPSTSFESNSSDGNSLILSDTSKDWINLVLGLDIPFFMVMSKIDLVSSNFAAQANFILLDYVAQEKKRLLNIQHHFNTTSLLQISAVTMSGIGNMQQYLYRLRSRHNLRLLNYFSDSMLPGSQFVFCVEGVQRVAEVGIVVLGRVVHGFVDISKNTVSGTFFAVDEQESCNILIKSIHRMRLPVHQAHTGQVISMAIEGIDLEDKCRKGSLISIGHYSASIDRITELEADVVGNFDPSSPLPSTPVTGTLHWLGNRWPCILTSLELFYGEIKYRAKFEISANALLSLPGTRLVFVSAQFRLQGTAFIPKKHSNDIHN